MDQRSELWAQGQDEAVSVNQRSLIDKVLARYSGELTIFRELLQNADDASARSVQIRFYTAEGAKQEDDKRRAGQHDSAGDAAGETSGSRMAVPDYKTLPIVRYVLLNDGTPFRPEDWSRLKKIADGNPDESKIGAFGVGFYSLFSVTEEPLVESNGTWMGFHWKGGGDQLFARSGALPSSSTTRPQSHFNLPLTSFTMDLRTPSPLPASPLELARFLATSLTFMNTLERAELFVDDRRLVLVEKETGTMKKVGVPADLERRSEGGLMYVEGLESTDVRMKAEILRLVYTTSSPPPAPPRPIRSAPTPTSSFASMLSGAFFSRSSTPTPAPLPLPPPPPPKDPYEPLPTTLSLRVMAADVSVKVGKALAVELERATKKNPPARTKVSLIFTGREEWERGEEELKEEGGKAEGSGQGSVWRGLRADLDGAGLAKIFIGHATGQTTGMGGHLSARFIPTVERESIDLVDRSVKIWNLELLFISGFLSRSIYELELAEIAQLWQGTTPTSQPPAELRIWLTGRALHALRFFSYFDSTPSAVVSRQMEAAFFACSKGPAKLSIVSSQGVFDALAQVRYPHKELAKFVKNVPVVPDSMLEEAGPMVHRLRERGMLKDLTLMDVIGELKNRVLDEDEMVHCLRWWIALSEVPSFDISLRSRILDVAMFNVKTVDPNAPTGSTSSERIIPLSSIRTYYDARRSTIPADVPLPPHTLPFSVTKTLPSEKLPHALGFKELLVQDWVAYLVSPALSGLPTSDPATDMRVSAVFSERILVVIAKAWQGLNAQAQASIFSTLSDKKIIPSRSGMVTPGEAYFPNVSLFPDLPIVAFPKGTAIKGAMKKLLVALGVRRHVELQLVFNRLLGAGGWSVQELVRYLVSVRENLSADEMEKLKQTPAFPAEGSKARFTPLQLYEPTDEHRRLKLNVLDWGTTVKWRPTSDEAKLLFALGLQRYPSIDVLLPLAAITLDASLQKAAFDYFVSHFSEHYPGAYFQSQSRNLAFVPAIKSTGEAFFASPLEVFTNPDCAALGFPVVASSFRADAVAKLRIASDPSPMLLVESLATSPPTTVEQAKVCFEYLASRISYFNDTLLRRLQLSSIVPVVKGGMVRRLRPSEVYFVSESQSSSLYKTLFTYVDFGPKANTFLRAIGVQAEPTVAEVAGLLVKDPKHFLDLAGTSDAYLDVLRNIATNLNRIPNSTRKEMSKAAMLLAHRRVKPTASSVATKKPLEKQPVVADEEDYEIVWELAVPSRILILDDPVVHLLFVDHIIAAPEESALEDFYLHLGAQRLSSRVHETYQQQTPLSDSSALALATKRLVLERLPLFLHERSKAALGAEALKKQLDVVEVRSLLLKRSLRLENGEQHVKSEPASAAVFREKGRIRLVVSGAFELDYYEVASALVKVVLSSPRAADALLLHTILSTPLSSLRRRGFNTDRILKAKKAERLAKEEAEKAQRDEDEKLALIANELEEMFPDADPNFIRATVASQDIEHMSRATEALLSRPYPKRAQAAPPPTDPTTSQELAVRPPVPAPPQPNGLVPASSQREKDSSSSNVLSNMFSKLNKTSSSLRHKSSSTAHTSSDSAGEHGPPDPSRSGPSGGLTQMTIQSQADRQKSPSITPLASTKNTVERAVNQSRGNRAREFDSRTREEETPVREAAEDYCDVTGAQTDLKLVGQEPGTRMQVYVDKSIADPLGLMREMEAPIGRFAREVLRPLTTIFKLDPQALHIFYDPSGPLIAFNRSHSIFCNLRYYVAWHDVAVFRGESTEAIKSWYFSVAHELAHNLVQPHNSEFSYYFSSIAETYLQALTRHLATITPAPASERPYT